MEASIEGGAGGQPQSQGRGRVPLLRAHVSLGTLCPVEPPAGEPVGPNATQWSPGIRWWPTMGLSEHLFVEAIQPWSCMAVSPSRPHS